MLGLPCGWSSSRRKPENHDGCVKLKRLRVSLGLRLQNDLNLFADDEDQRIIANSNR